MPNPNTESKVKRTREQLALMVRGRRAERNLSQSELAQNAGISPARISEIENEQSDPRLSTLVRLADALDLDVRVEPAA